jgi:tetratricopeptide (TPR) repeat protein
LLVVVSTPRDCPALNTEQEWTNLCSALADLKRRELVALDQLDRPTLPALAERLLQDEYHVLHFIGHGKFQDQSGVLVFENEAGLSDDVGGERLGTVLHNHDPLRLVFLNACSTAEGSSRAAFAGIAQQLARHRVPAVLAMQRPISDTAAITIAKTFYEALARGEPVDAALTAARVQVFTGPDPVEFGTPVLYLGATDGRIFAVQPLSEAEQEQNKIANLAKEARAAMAREDWATASARWNDVLDLDPSHPDATPGLKRARARQEVPALYAAGLEHYNAGRWREAWEQLRRIQAIDASYQTADILRMIANAQRQMDSAPAGALVPTRRPAAARAGAGSLDLLYRTLITASVDGHLVPFIGPDANLCCRPAGTSWQYGEAQYPPSTEERAEYLATYFDYPWTDVRDLGRVAQYAAVRIGSADLFGRLHELYGIDYPPGTVHQFFATLPAALRASGHQPRNQLIVTANCDDLLERAFRAANEPFDVVTYVAEENQHGAFWHLPAKGEARRIEIPNDYPDLPPLRPDQPATIQRTVILKIHGALDRANTERSGFLVTEDQYIDYSKRISNLVPKPISARLSHSHFLFLGYRPRDWNLRVFLSIWLPRTSRSYRSWAVQLQSSEADEPFWDYHNVDVLDVGLEDLIATLSERARALPPTGARNG